VSACVATGTYQLPVMPLWIWPAPAGTRFPPADACGQEGPCRRRDTQFLELDLSRASEWAHHVGRGGGANRETRQVGASLCRMPRDVYPACGAHVQSKVTYRTTQGQRRRYLRFDRTVLDVDFAHGRGIRCWHWFIFRRQRTGRGHWSSLLEASEVGCGVARSTTGDAVSARVLSGSDFVRRGEQRSGFNLGRKGRSPIYLSNEVCVRSAEQRRRAKAK